jgi:hypothetical protein
MLYYNSLEALYDYYCWRIGFSNGIVNVFMPIPLAGLVNKQQKGIAAQCEKRAALTPLAWWPSARTSGNRPCKWQLPVTVRAPLHPWEKARPCGDTRRRRQAETSRSRAPRISARLWASSACPHRRLRHRGTLFPPVVAPTDENMDRGRGVPIIAPSNIMSTGWASTIKRSLWGEEVRNHLRPLSDQQPAQPPWDVNTQLCTQMLGQVVNICCAQTWRRYRCRWPGGERR